MAVHDLRRMGRILPDLRSRSGGPRTISVVMTALLVGMLVCPRGWGQEINSQAAGQQVRTGSTPIQHVVFLIRENRSFDNLFGTFPNANGATNGPISTGQILALKHAPDALAHD